VITPPGNGFATATDDEVRAAISAPLPPGEARVMYCGTCGAVTYIRFPGSPTGSGDPVGHGAWHRERGES
jgi:hypothetical protein